MESSEHNWANISETICPEMLVFGNILTNPIISLINTLLLPYLISYSSSSFTIVCYTAVGGGALRDDTKNGCVADYIYN